jgi:site-specific DNA recombinase
MGNDFTGKKAAGYIRVSTEEQTERFGLEIQRDEIQAYAKKNSFQLYKIYEDAGISGSNMDRPALLEMLDVTATDSFDTVIVYKTDRLARDNFMAWWIEKELKKTNTALISITEPYRLEDPSGRLFYAIISAFADYERSMIMARTKAGRIKKAKGGGYAGGNLTYGYDIWDGKLILNEREAKIVERVFRSYSRGKSMNKIAQEFRVKEIATKQGGKWWASTISEILGNSLYVGETSYGGIETNGQQERIISKRLFNKVQNKRRRNEG